MSGATIHAVGNLTKDPELRYTEDGRPFITMTCAVNTYHGPDNTTVLYYDLILFGNRAETINKHCSRGAKVYFSGQHDIRDFTNEAGEVINRNRSGGDIRVQEFEWWSPRAANPGQNDENPDCD